jgi:hypothetical protein
MHRISTALNVSPAGKVTVLYAGTDASAALAAYKGCVLPGKSVVIINAAPERSKHLRPVTAAVQAPEPEPVKRAKSK